jgi:hypothetical protein
MNPETEARKPSLGQPSLSLRASLGHGTHAHELVTVPEQLSEVAFSRRRNPNSREAIVEQEVEDERGVAFIRFLLAYFASTDLEDPYCYCRPTTFEGLPVLVRTSIVTDMQLCGTTAHVSPSFSRISFTKILSSDGLSLSVRCPISAKIPA